MDLKKIDAEIVELMSCESTLDRGFSLLFRTYNTLLYKTIFRMLHDDNDTQDVLQNVFVKAYKSIKSFRGDSTLLTWLYRIAHNESITWLNKQINTKKKHQDLLQINSDCTIHTSASEDIQLMLTKAIETLPPRQKSVFVARYFDECTYKEMAKIYNLSEGGLKASYHHAVKKIEEYLTANVLR